MNRLIGFCFFLTWAGAFSVLAQDVKQPKEVSVSLGNNINLDLVLIPAGKFTMGSPKSEKKREDNESQHEVVLSKSFYLGKYEVTQEQCQAVMGKNPSEVKEPKLPVTEVSWLDCQDFIKILNEKSCDKGLGGFRLPTEAEWEYACRAGTTTTYSFGIGASIHQVNYNRSETKPVGSFKPNAFGLYDMHGNVWEWCNDWFEYYPEGQVTDPMGSKSGTHRILRGGAFNLSAMFVRSAIRNVNTPTKRLDTIGFRLAKS